MFIFGPTRQVEVQEHFDSVCFLPTAIIFASCSPSIGKHEAGLRHSARGSRFELLVCYEILKTPCSFLGALVKKLDKK